MEQYVLVNKVEKELFEKQYQLPYGCGSCSIYPKLSNALALLMNMWDNKRKEYVIEKWEAGEFVEIVFDGGDL